MRFHQSLFVLPLLMAGCAKSPVGGPTNPQANNILRVSIAVAGQINPTYYYDFAFDDDETRSTGPVALARSQSTFANGVTGGTFTVLVRYNLGQFIAYRRSLNADNSENLVRYPNAFTIPPSVDQTGKTLSFALNLDATLPDGSRLFRGSDNGIPRQLRVNFITTDAVNNDPNDNRSNTFDALGNRTGGKWLPLTNTNLPKLVTNGSILPEPAGDVTNFSNLDSNDINSLDLTDYRIEIQRNSN